MNYKKLTSKSNIANDNNRPNNAEIIEITTNKITKQNSIFDGENNKNPINIQNTNNNEENIDNINTSQMINSPETIKIPTYFDKKISIFKNYFNNEELFLPEIPENSYYKSKWLSSPINKNIWFKGKLKIIKDEKKNISLFKYYNDKSNILLLTAIKKGHKYLFFLEDNINNISISSSSMLKIGSMTNNFLGNQFIIQQDINNYLSIITYQINLFGLRGPMKLKTILMNNYKYISYNKPPYYNLCKYIFFHSYI